MKFTKVNKTYLIIFNFSRLLKLLTLKDFCELDYLKFTGYSIFYGSYGSWYWLQLI